MAQVRKLHLLLIVILAVFSILLPQEKSAVLCFDGDGDPSIREAGHFICKDLHSEFEISEEEVHDHDHCSDVELPSFLGKIQKVRTFLSVAFEPSPVYYKVNIKAVYFKTSSLKPVYKGLYSYNSTVLSKAILIC